MSMPCIGQVSFLLQCTFRFSGLLSCVNALYRASLISTGCVFEYHSTDDRVSMPCIGQVSFLLTKGYYPPIRKDCVNALYRASLISTALAISCLFFGIYVSMPCIGQVSFLRKESSGGRKESCRCQCPVSGKSHFYSSLPPRTKAPRTVCQCPVSGKSHFYNAVCK